MVCVDDDHADNGHSPDILVVLAKLHAILEMRYPTITPFLRHGLSDADIDALEIALTPYKLPTALREMYKWHDGATNPCQLLPGYDYLSFAEALKVYQRACSSKHSDHGEGWNPLWFPIFSLDGSLYCVTLTRDGAMDSSVYYMPRQDTDLYIRYGSLATMIAVITACFAQRAYAFVEEHDAAREGDQRTGRSSGVPFDLVLDTYLEVHDTQEVEIRARYCSQCYPFVQQKGVTIFGVRSTQHWPQAWRDAIGRTAADYVPKGRTMAVAECLDAIAQGHFQKALLQGRVIGLRGDGYGVLCEVQDDTGRITVWCPRTARGAREFQGEKQYEFQVRLSTAAERTELEERISAKTMVMVEHLIRLD